MDHTIMHLHQHHHSPEEQWIGDQRDVAMATGTHSTASVGVSQVAFALSAVALLSLFSSSSLGGAAAVWASSPSLLPSGAALSADARHLLASLCGFVTTKQALFLLSNAIFLFLAADCRCYFSGVCGMATPSTTSDNVVTSSELPSSSCAVQAQPCGSSSGSLYCCSNIKSASAECSGQQGIKQEEVPVSSQPESSGLDGDEANIDIVTLETTTCRGVAEDAEEELENLDMDELNRKFEDFIQSKRIKWLKEKEEVEYCIANRSSSL